MSEASVGDDSVSDDSGPRRLEGRARRLLRAYPPGYRGHRGEEILGTLLEATPPGRSWPPARDTASVLAGGLRARREANQRQGLAVSLRQAALLGVTLYLLGLMTIQLVSYLHFAVAETGPGPTGPTAFLPLAVLAPLAAAWCGRRRLAAGTGALAGLADLACAYAPVHLVVLERGVAVPLLALAALVLVTRDGERPPRSWLWLPVLGAGLPAALSYWFWSTPVGHLLNEFNAWVTPWPDLAESFPLIMAAVCVCWLVTDFRPLTGVAVGFVLTQAFTGLAYPFTWTELIEAAVALAVAVDLARRLRRRARTAPPAG